MRRQAGFTLIEIVVALAISAMLAIAAMGVVAGLARSERAQGRSRSRESLEAGMRGLLARDIRQADQYRTTQDGIELHTWQALDPATLDGLHLESVVGYKVAETSRHMWLVREQKSEIGGNLTELVCRGVTAVRLDASVTDNTTLLPAASGKAPPAAAAAKPQDDGKWKKMPPAVTFTVEFNGEPPEMIGYRFTRGQ